jgi:DNA (cytosine-5)-methyltransferase 1
MENVHHLASFAGRNIAEEVAASAEEVGYHVRYAILKAVWYGVPQMRERLFIIGIHRRLEAAPVFPTRSHTIQLPVGYTTSRSGRPDYSPVLRPSSHYVGEVAARKELHPPVTVEEALGDLPPITTHLGDPRARRGARKFDHALSYRQSQPSPYAMEMRTWPGFESKGTIADHVIRYTPRDYETFRRMRHGDQYPEAYSVAERRFEEAIAAGSPRPQPRTQRYSELRAAIVPPHDPGKFPNKWRKMEADQPSRTIPAHIGKDSYSHIHYDSFEG